MSELSLNHPKNPTSNRTAQLGSITIVEAHSQANTKSLGKLSHKLES